MTKIFLVLILLSSYTNVVAKEMPAIEIGDLKYEFITEETLRQETGHSTWTFNYSQTNYRNKTVAIFLASGASCEIWNNIWKAENLRRGLGEYTYTLMTEIPPSMTSLHWAVYMTDELSDMRSLTAAEADCEKSRIANGYVLSAAPVFLVLGEIQQKQRTARSFREPYFVMHYIYFSDRWVDSFFVPGETAKILGEFALKVFAKKALSSRK